MRRLNGFRYTSILPTTDLTVTACVPASSSLLDLDRFLLFDFQSWRLIFASHDQVLFIYGSQFILSASALHGQLTT
jgi:hypothetical protein